MKARQKFNIEYVDPSGLSKFNRCPTSYMLSRLEGLVKPNRTTLAMDYGTDMHEVLPYCYGNESPDYACKLFKDLWEKRAHDDDDKRNLQCAENTIYEFINSHNELCPYKIVDLNITAPTQATISKNEIPFLIDIGGSLPLAGRMDCAVRWKSDNSLWALDYKTSGEVSKRLFSNFENCPQALAYTLALSQTTGERARGLIIEVIRVSKKNAESHMHMVFIQDHQISDFIAMVNRTATDILKCNETMEWENRCTGCAPYSQFGSPGYQCDYMSICTNPDKHSMLKFFDKRPPFHPYIVSS